MQPAPQEHSPNQIPLTHPRATLEIAQHGLQQDVVPTPDEFRRRGSHTSASDTSPSTVLSPIGDGDVKLKVQTNETQTTRQMNTEASANTTESTFKTLEHFSTRLNTRTNLESLPNGMTKSC
jgi:hypothetical protein